MKKYRYNLSHLDCANCAREIEEKLNELKDYQNVQVNFAKMTLSFESDYEGDVLLKIQEEVQKIEKSVLVSKDKIKKESIQNDVIRILFGLGLFLISMFFPNQSIQFVLLILSYGVLLENTVMNSIRLMKKGILNENFLISISAIGAFLIDKSSEGFMVIFLYEIGKILEKKATGNVRESVSLLLDLTPSVAHLKKKNQVIDVSPDEVSIHDEIVVLKGEKVPLDGIVLEGRTNLNTASLTGESELVSVKEQDNILSGSINEGNVITMKVTSLYENSTVKKILDLMEHATDKKTKTENFVSRASKIYTPVMLGIAILIFLLAPFLFDITFSESFYRALTILVISCPCAIAISVPLCYFAGIGSMSKKGILVKGSSYIDVLKNLKHIVFDKTGTLTTGEFGITNIEVINSDYKEEEILNYLIYGESFSTHPLAKSVLKIVSEIEIPKIKNFQEIDGKGISYEYHKKKIRLGNAKFVNSPLKRNGTVIYVSINEEVVGIVSFGDEVKENSKECIRVLKNESICTYMFTGDQKDSALKIGSSLGLDTIKYELLPNDKFTEFERLKKEKKGEFIAFVGDGINDAPVLRLSDCGISMGSGATSAIEASDVVIMSNDPLKIIEAKRVSNKTIGILKQNLILAIGLKFLVLILGFFGIGSMWLAVFADVGVTLITILNSLRILK